MARPGHSADRRIALGVAPHSGWAAVVGIGEAEGRPQVLVRERIEMAAADDGGAKRPYHTVEDLAVEEARKRLTRYAAAAESMASAAVRRIVSKLERDRHRVIGLGILDSSGRKGDSLEAVLASHALIHTADGNHFREALAAAAAGCQLEVSRIRAGDLDREAAETFGRPAAALRDTVKEMGRSVGPPWGADQKAAALLGWVVLTRAR